MYCLEPSGRSRFSRSCRYFSRSASRSISSGVGGRGAVGNPGHASAFSGSAAGCSGASIRWTAGSTSCANSRVLANRLLVGHGAELRNDRQLGERAGFLGRDDPVEDLFRRPDQQIRGVVARCLGRTLGVSGNRGCQHRRGRGLPRRIGLITLDALEVRRVGESVVDVDIAVGRPDPLFGFGRALWIGRAVHEHDILRLTRRQALFLTESVHLLNFPTGSLDRLVAHEERHHAAAGEDLQRLRGRRRAVDAGEQVAALRFGPQRHLRHLEDLPVVGEPLPRERQLAECPGFR